MNSLNTDCLIEIIKLLNLKDQISVYQANSSLRLAVTTFWLIKYKQIHIHFLEFALTNEEFEIILQAVQDSVEVLQLRFLNKEKYEVLKKFRFTRVTDFRFTLVKPYFMVDGDLKDLKQVVPNLRAFSPHGYLTGVHMDEWSLLKELNLSFCPRLEMPHFENIMRRLDLEKLKLNIFPNNNEFEQLNLQDAQVENLKYLELNTYEFYYFLTKPLKSLKELIITNRYNPRQLFDVLLSIWQAKDIRSMETANVDDILLNCVAMNMNVEQLAIINDENPLPANVMPSLHQLTNLRKLRFKSCFIYVKDFIELLINCPQLDEISFENCYFDVTNIYLKIEDVCDKRAGKLRLNMFENRLMDNLDRPTWCREMLEQLVYVTVEMSGNKKLMELTHFKGETLCYEPLYVAFR